MGRVRPRIVPGSATTGLGSMRRGSAGPGRRCGRRQGRTRGGPGVEVGPRDRVDDAARYDDAREGLRRRLRGQDGQQRSGVRRHDRHVSGAAARVDEAVRHGDVAVGVADRNRRPAIDARGGIHAKQEAVVADDEQRAARAGVLVIGGHGADVDAGGALPDRPVPERRSVVRVEATVLVVGAHERCAPMHRGRRAASCRSPGPDSVTASWCEPRKARLNGIERDHGARVGAVEVGR